MSHTCRVYERYFLAISLPLMMQLSCFYVFWFSTNRRFELSNAIVLSESHGIHCEWICVLDPVSYCTRKEVWSRVNTTSLLCHKVVHRGMVWQSVNLVQKDMNMGHMNFGTYTFLLSGGLISVQITIFGLTHVDPNFYLRKPFTLLILLLRSKNCCRLYSLATYLKCCKGLESMFLMHSK